MLTAKDRVLLQPSIKPEDIHPRNKKGGVGSVYNAFRLHDLPFDELKKLHDRCCGGYVMHDGCFLTVKKAKSVGSNACALGKSKRPRGADYRGLLAGTVTKTTIELTHLVLYMRGIYPKTSEDEVDHLCSQPFCLEYTHLKWSLHRANHDREKCRHTRVLTCPQCGHMYNECKHTPACVPCTCENVEEDESNSMDVTDDDGNNN